LVKWFVLNNKQLVPAERAMVAPEPSRTSKLKNIDLIGTCFKKTAQPTTYLKLKRSGRQIDCVQKPFINPSVLKIYE
jgi:hypothetical protein